MNENRSGEGTQAVLLDSRALALRCMKLDRAFEAQEERTERAEQEVRRLETELEAGRVVRELGLSALKRMEQETRSRLMAMAQHEGDWRRVQAFDALVRDGEHDVERIRRCHAEVEAEFDALFSTRPVSRGEGGFSAGNEARMWKAYQFTPDGSGE